LITLTFSPQAGSQILVRAPFFRICPDATLRGPESSVVATYMARTWRLGARWCREFHCVDDLYLRVSPADGKQLLHGPYQYLRAAEGALFTGSTCLAIHSSEWNEESGGVRWNEITLLSNP
jgi:hypothetical protein